MFINLTSNAPLSLINDARYEMRVTRNCNQSSNGQRLQNHFLQRTSQKLQIRSHVLTLLDSHQQPHRRPPLLQYLSIKRPLRLRNLEQNLQPQKSAIRPCIPGIFIHPFRRQRVNDRRGKLSDFLFCEEEGLLIDHDTEDGGDFADH